MRAFPQFRINLSEYMDAFSLAELNVRSVEEVPVQLPGRGVVLGVSVFHCKKIRIERGSCSIIRQFIRKMATYRTSIPQNIRAG
jgi:hypothetical protein